MARRGPSFLGLARVLAWGAGHFAALVVAYTYPALPDELPLSRWVSAPKSMFLALRAPFINLAMLGLCEVLARMLGRAPAEQRRFADAAAAAVLCTAGLKAMLTASEIVRLPEPRPSSALVSLGVVAIGLALAAWFAQPLLRSGSLRALRPTPIERMLVVALVALIALLNIPSVVSLAAPRLLR